MGNGYGNVRNAYYEISYWSSHFYHDLGASSLIGAKWGKEFSVVVKI